MPGNLRKLILLPILIVASTALSGMTWAEDYEAERAALVREVSQDVRELSQALGRRSLSPQVMTALKSVPRHLFVPPRSRSRAYLNSPLSIGYGQTVSQPLIVAVMTDLLELSAGDRVFELGTGSGYQAAVLAALNTRVYSMEIIAPLGLAARDRLQQLGYDGVEVKIGDGYNGWPAAGPFDGIIVTAAGDHVPPPLIRQLKPGGRMVLPVGGRFFAQQLIVIHKQEDGSLTTRKILPVAFVPLTGGH